MEQLEHASNIELLSTLTGKPAAEALLHQYGGLTNLAQASFDELQNVKGIGKSKAAAIKSAFLLAQRLSKEAYPESPLLDTPERVADLLREDNRLYTVENFQVVFLNTRRRLIGRQNLSQGTLDTLLVHPREVFLAAIKAQAAAIVVVHNLCAAAHRLCYVTHRCMCSASAWVRRNRPVSSPRPNRPLHITRACPRTMLFAQWPDEQRVAECQAIRIC
jgi:DNA repair protein RadC